MKKTSIVATAAAISLLLSGCVPAYISSSRDYVKEVEQLTENIYPDVDLTYTPGYGQADYNLADSGELAELLGYSCRYATEKGAIEDRGTFVEEGRWATVVFPKAYAAEVAAEHDANWGIGETYGFIYPMFTGQYNDLNFDNIDLSAFAQVNLEGVPLISPCTQIVFLVSDYLKHKKGEKKLDEIAGVFKISENLYQKQVMPGSANI